MKPRIVYSAVIENRGDGDNVYLCLVREGESGYHRLAPGYGPYPSWDDACVHANELNKSMGIDQCTATMIVLGTMAHGRRRHLR